MENLSKKKLDYLIRDEKMAVKEYRKLGLEGLARDEERHKNFFLMLKSKRR